MSEKGRVLSDLNKWSKPLLVQVPEALFLTANADVQEETVGFFPSLPFVRFGMNHQAVKGPRALPLSSFTPFGLCC